MLKMNIFRTFRFLGGAQIRLQNTNAAIPLENIAKPKITREQRKSGLVAAAFASLNNDTVPLVPDSINATKNTISINKLIDSASDAQSLLSIAEKQLSREDSLKIISKLAQLSSQDKIQLSEFQADNRFINLCQFLGKQQKDSREYYDSKSEDLSTVLGVTGDDRAAKLVSGLSVQQMVKVMSNLAAKRRRSIPLLRALSYNITKNTETIDIKKCADLLYAMALLNFPDPVLMERLCCDIHTNLDSNKEKSSVVGSIVTSLGILKFKDSKLLDSILEWFVNHKDISRVQDIAAYVITIASLGHITDAIQNLPTFMQSDFARSSSYLDYVWSLMVLNNVTKTQIQSVFSPEFLENLKMNGEIPFPCLKKLCNINGYVSLFIKDYEGPVLSDQLFDSLQISYSKEKLQYVGVLLDTLKSLLSSEKNIRKNCDSKMGFLYDALMVLDKKCNPHAVDSIESPKGKSLIKIAVLGLDYHDLCKNSREPLGSILLYKSLLEKKGFRVLLIPYTEFSTSEKLMYRVQYMDRRIKEIVSQ